MAAIAGYQGFHFLDQTADDLQTEEGKYPPVLFFHHHTEKARLPRDRIGKRFSVGDTTGRFPETFADLQRSAIFRGLQVG